MTIKESSDELNPSVITAGSAVSDLRPHSAKDYLALAIATCGVGYFPLAPGTLGSLVGVALYLFLRHWFLKLLIPIGERNYLFQFEYGLMALELVAVTIVTLIGIWAASRTEKLSGKKDPGKVVVDEVAGQMIALLTVPLLARGSETLWIVVAFVLFRVFDIIKPYPARRLESLESGLGIMADDVVAGAYAAVAVAVMVLIQWSI